MDTLNFRSELWRMSQLTNLCIEQGARPILDDSGLTLLQARVLMEIHRNDQMTVGRLAKQLDLAKGNTSSMCKKLEQQGIIERIRDARDERYVMLVLTDEGKAKITEIENRMEAKYGPIFARMSDEERECVLRSIQILTSILKQVQDS